LFEKVKVLTLIAILLSHVNSLFNSKKNSKLYRLVEELIVFIDIIMNVDTSRIRFM